MLGNPPRRRASGAGRPSNAELARRLNQARVQLCREKQRNAKAEADAAALLALVPDPDQKLTFEEWEKLPQELFQLQLDFLDCRDLGLPLFVAGESPEDRTARVYEALLAHDGLTHKEALEKVALWKQQREEKAGRERALPIPPQRSLPLAEEDSPTPSPQPLETNPSHALTPGQIALAESEREIEMERQRLQQHNILNGVDP